MNNKIESMINLVYFCFNFPHGFLEKAFKDDSQIEHLKSKLRSVSSGQFIYAGEMLEFMTSLSADRQHKLMDWIDSNYDHKL